MEILKTQICQKCKKSSQMQCPTCLKLGLPPSYFCSQECFKSEWPEHKNEHNVGPYEIPEYKFTVFFYIRKNK